MSDEQLKTIAAHQPPADPISPEQAMVIVSAQQVRDHLEERRRSEPEHIAVCIARGLNAVGQCDLATLASEQADWDAKNYGDRFDGLY